MADAPRQGAADVIDLGPSFRLFRKVWWKAALAGIAAGLAALLAMSTLPNIYRATAVIAPAAEEGKQAPFLGGALASFGIVVGGPTKVEDLESLFKSDDLTVRVFRKYDLWPTVKGDCYDSRTKTLKSGWLARLTGGGKEAKAPGDWDAIREARNGLKVAVNKRAGTLVISFDSRSPDGSATIVRYFLEEGKSRLQEEAFARANTNKKFIGDQIGKTVDPLTRDRLYTLYGQEVEREMMAKNREQFGFKIVDNPRIPDRKDRPHRAKGAISGAVAGFFAFLGFAYIRERNRYGAASAHEPAPGDKFTNLP